MSLPQNNSLVSFRQWVLFICLILPIIFSRYSPGWVHCQAWTSIGLLNGFTTIFYRRRRHTKRIENKWMRNYRWTTSVWMFIVLPFVRNQHRTENTRSWSFQTPILSFLWKGIHWRYSTSISFATQTFFRHKIFANKNICAAIQISGRPTVGHSRGPTGCLWYLCSYLPKCWCRWGASAHAWIEERFLLWHLWRWIYAKKKLGISSENAYGRTTICLRSMSQNVYTCVGTAVPRTNAHRRTTVFVSILWQNV